MRFDVLNVETESRLMGEGEVTALRDCRTVDQLIAHNQPHKPEQLRKPTQT